MSAPVCEKRSTTWGTCLAKLADGWIGPPDLCPACTRAFMAALDSVAGSLQWHRGFRERAEASEDGA